MRFALLVALVCAVSYTCGQTVHPMTPGVPLAFTAPAGQWAYFALNVSNNFHELNIAMSQTSELGDPDLYVRHAALPTAETFDGRDTTIDRNHTISVRTSDTAYPLTAGVYFIGVFAYGTHDASFILNARLWECFGDCSGHGTCELEADTHKCACEPEWSTNKPDCSSPIVVMNDTTKYREHIANGMIRYYNYTLTKESIQVAINMKRLRGTGLTTILVAFNRYPSYTDFDGIDRDYFQPQGDNEYEIYIEPPKLTLGRWTIAVMSNANEEFDFELSYTVNQCPKSCNGRGVCNVLSHKCECDVHWSGTSDCSQPNDPLVPGTATAQQIDAFGSLVYRIAIPSGVDKKRVELRLDVDQGVSQYNSYARVYLSPDMVPTRLSHFMASRLPTAQITDLRVASGDLVLTKQWFVLVDNRVSEQVRVTLKLVFEAYCLHGKASVLGQCECTEGWTGDDCSVRPPINLIEGGVVAVVLLVILSLGIVLGFCVKHKNPRCCASKELQPHDIGYNPVLN